MRMHREKKKYHNKYKNQVYRVWHPLIKSSNKQWQYKNRKLVLRRRLWTLWRAWWTPRQPERDDQSLHEGELALHQGCTHYIRAAHTSKTTETEEGGQGALLGEHRKRTVLYAPQTVLIQCYRAPGTGKSIWQISIWIINMATKTNETKCWPSQTPLIFEESSDPISGTNLSVNFS